MARVNQVVAFTQNDDGTQTYKIGGQSVVFHPDVVDPTLRAQAELHGWRQRIQDKAALSRDPKTGRSATPEDKFAAVAAIVKHYESGTDKWEMPRAGGGGGRSELSYVMEALANVQGMDLEGMAERVARVAEKKGITTEQFLRKVATKPDIATEIARIKHGAASEDADDLVDQLMEEQAADNDEAAAADGMVPETDETA